MGIKQDFDELKAKWKNWPLHWKLLSVLLLFQQLLSVASLQEGVFKFKGFLLEGILLYRSLLEPVLSFVHRVFQINISTEIYDGSVIIGIFFGVFYRVNRSNSGREILNRPLSGAKQIMLLTMIIAYFLLLIFLPGKDVLLTFIMFILLMSFYCWELNEWIGLIHMLLPFFIVAILAAIANGLAK